jgi:hypothetical protein
MNPGLSLFGLSAAAPTIALARQTALTAVEPFQNIFASAADRTAAADPSTVNPEQEGLRARLARRLQELMRSLGAIDGDQVSLRVDEAGAIAATGFGTLAEGVETALREDGVLADQIRALAEFNAAQNDSAWLGDAELRVTATTGDTATLEWR